MILACTVSFVYLFAQHKVVRLKVVQTSDVHGNFFPTDFIRQCPAEGSLARVTTFVKEQRQKYGNRLLLLDNGDILQGQPSAYYYNYIDTVSTHLTAAVMNYMQYDAGNMGNHDIETGRKVFDRWMSDCAFPMLGANIVDVASGKPHCQPYTIFEREGVKVAVLGMITPAIPVWLSENLWQGLRFDDMEETARRWVKIIQEKEKPDVLIGIFHAGQRPLLMGGKFRENASLQVAVNVPGFDLVLMGHDHARECKKVVNVAGDTVLVMNPANHARVVSDAELVLTLNDGKLVSKQMDGKLIDMSAYEPDEAFMQHFSTQYQAVENFVLKKIGRLTKTISTRPAYFGPSDFVDLIHQLQLAISGAEISLVAPLSFDAEIQAGDVKVSDMFNLYKYENMLYTMRLSGREIKGLLEMSYGQWINQMKSEDDDLLLFRSSGIKGAEERSTFRYPSYNFDSAAGIIYTVDVTKPAGERVHVVQMADGKPFLLDKFYEVALNSYRGNGGGELLTKGAGIAQEDLKNRIIRSTDKDLRYYLMRYIEQQKVIEPCALNQWKLIPEQWTLPAAKRDYRRLFGEISNKLLSLRSQKI
ncbi:5'-nucleotidase family protein [gut metagenome]|uniref:5'-nucleotidase family protein n=1 Tax=gut metagenome TaxID=749906 RepID=J9GLW5_9ZZZZ